MRALAMALAIMLLSSCADPQRFARPGERDLCGEAGRPPHECR